MASEYVVDASALIEALASRADGTARHILRDARCHAPHLLDAEVGGVLRRRSRGGLLTEAQARSLLRAGALAIHERYPHGPLAAAAWDLRDNLSYYDALYAALAGKLGLPLLTADQRLANTPGLPCAVELIK
ncbi:MAG: type II toxin-antitoxin system VapC family toxin [Haloechinothrix sp.]